MAEAIGTTAALLSVLEYSFKALGVVSKLRDAPKTVHGLALQMQQLHQTISAIQANPALSADTATLQPMLVLCLNDVQILQTQLAKVTCDCSDRVLGKSWKSLVGVIKEKSIKAVCDKLERHKSTLALYMANKNVVLLNRVDARLATILSRVNADHSYIIHELETVKAMSTKPAALATELKRFDNAPTTPSLNDNLSASRLTTHIVHRCRCFQIFRSAARWGSSESILGTGNLLVAQHRADCPTKMSKRGVRSCLRYALPRWLLNLTVEAQFMMTYGAGGYSLAPTLGVNHTVSDRSPMIRLLSNFRYEPIHERTRNQILPRVRNLFLEGKASPSDVDASGNNYLNFLFTTPGIVPDGDLELFLELVLFFIGSGININQVNIMGQSPLCQAINTLWAFLPLETLLNVLQREGATFISMTPELIFGLHAKGDVKRLNPYLVWRDGICYLRNQKSIAEDSKLYGPLSLAVIARALEDVRTLLQKHIGFDEKNAYGQTPLHLCGDWSAGTEALLAAGHAYDPCDSSGLRPLDYALAFGGTEAVPLLLSMGCMLSCQHSTDCCATRGFSSWHFFNRDLESQRQIWPLHPNWYALVGTIKEKREELAKMAYRYLPQGLLIDLERCGTDIDDLRATETELALVQHAISIPTRIQTSRVSIYHSIYTIDAARHLFATGFRDLNVYDHLGYTPLMTCVSRTVYSVSQYEERLPLLEWMLQLGANPLKLHRDLHTNALHEALRLVWYNTNETSSMRFFGSCTSLGHWPFFRSTDPVVSDQDISYSSIPPLALRLLREVSPRSRDQCRCVCSPSGCTPTTILHKYGMPRYSVHQQMRLVYEWLNAIARLNGPVEEACKELYRLHEFDHLGLTHTCCRDTYPAVRLLDADDVLEIQDEEEELIAQLEKSVEDYESGNVNRNGDFNWPDSYWSELAWDGPPPTLRWVNL